MYANVSRSGLAIAAATVTVSVGSVVLYLWWTGQPKPPEPRAAHNDQDGAVHAAAAPGAAGPRPAAGTAPPATNGVDAASAAAGAAQGPGAGHGVPASTGSSAAAASGTVGARNGPSATAPPVATPAAPVATPPVVSVAHLPPPAGLVADDALCEIYSSMAAKFLQAGLNLEFVREMSGCFEAQETPGAARAPLPYTRSPLGCLAPNVSRLLVLPVATKDSSFDRLGQRIATAISKVLPMGMHKFVNDRENYHITLFFTSRYDDPRPDPLVAGGGTSLSLPADQRASPSQDALDRELAACRAVAGSLPKPSLRLERVFLADSGTLLITWTDPSSVVWRIRAGLVDAFPGRPTKQPRIIHTSLLRVLTPSKIDDFTRQRLNDVCQQWTDKLRGRVLEPSCMWMVYETEYVSIRGEKHLCYFAGQGAGTE